MQKIINFYKMVVYNLLKKVKLHYKILLILKKKK